MTKSVLAVYENGLLRPLEPLPFREHQQLIVTVSDVAPLSDELVDIEFLRDCQMQADDSVSLEQVRAALSKIPGSMADEIRKERNDGGRFTADGPWCKKLMDQ